ncbi:MAG TPA: alcohol dehydrogenase catalytic domain-containing protein [Burkholderiales bacterium]|nr:alcohol dehydrogenase catalytic domain-containing protein [Burkholderiales bacterium]
MQTETSMQAVIFERAGKAETVLAVHDMPCPVPDRNQVLVRVAARPIQPADFLFIEGRYRVKPAFPQVAGLEGVGTVIACGSDVTGLEPGMRVAFRAPGSWAEFAVAPATRIYPVPPEISDALACQFALNPLTAWALLSECDLPKSSRLLITAGRSTVARLLAKLAERKGLNATLLVRDGSGYAVLEDDNGRVVSKQATVAETLQKIAQHGLFHAILDPIGGPNTLALIDALEPKGRLISYGVLDDGEIALKASRILYKNMIWQGFGIDGWLNNAPREHLDIAQRELWEMLSAHPELLSIIGSFSLSRVQEAIRTVRTIHRPGKVILTG